MRNQIMEGIINEVLHSKAAIAVGICSLTIYMVLKHFGGGVCRSNVSMKGKTVIITGCNTGIGKETALDLAKRGARIIMACRNLSAAEKAAEEIRTTSENGQVRVMMLDLSSFASVRCFAKDFLASENRLDVLINNAGLMTRDKIITPDGFELTWQTNHLGPFLLTNLLLDRLTESKPARIVNVSSTGHAKHDLDMHFEDLTYEKRPFDQFGAYCTSKFANVLFTKELTKRLDQNEITTYTPHPGVVRTEFFRQAEDMYPVLVFIAWTCFWPFYKTPKQGAQTTIYCSLDEKIAENSGQYYMDCHETPSCPESYNEELATKLWNMSTKSVQL